MMRSLFALLHIIKPILRYSFFSLLLGGILALLSCQNILAETTASSADTAIEPQPDEHLFVPINSLPNFADFQSIAWQHSNDFNNLLAFSPKCSFFDIPGFDGEALSDHLTTWSEFAQCLNSAATRYSQSNPDTTPHDLWTSEMEPYIKRRVVSRQILGSPFYTKVFLYDVISEHADEAAMLPAATVKQYVNWRNVQYWLYHQLKKEEALLHQQPVNQEPEDQITTYFRKKNIYPPIDYIHSIDHTDEILAQSTELGCYWFSKSEDTGMPLTNIAAKTTFFLPTKDQKASWDVSYAARFSLQSIPWTAESVQDSNNDSTKKAAVQLAVNKEIMMEGEEAAAEETPLKKLAQTMQQGLVLLKSTDAYQQASQREQDQLATACLDTLAALSFLFGAGEIACSLGEASELTPLYLEREGYRPIVLFIARGDFTVSDCQEANAIIRSYHGVELTSDQIAAIVREGEIPVSTEGETPASTRISERIVNHTPFSVSERIVNHTPFSANDNSNQITAIVREGEIPVSTEGETPASTRISERIVNHTQFSANDNSNQITAIVREGEIPVSTEGETPASTRISERIVNHTPFSVSERIVNHTPFSANDNSNQITAITGGDERVEGIQHFTSTQYKALAKVHQRKRARGGLVIMTISFFLHYFGTSDCAY